MASLALRYETAPTQRAEHHAFSLDMSLFNQSAFHQGTLGTLLAPAWQRGVKARLDGLLALAQGWDGYSSAPISPTVVQFVLDVLASTMTHFSPAPSIVPVSGGGLQLEWHEGGLDIELYVSKPYQAELHVGYLDGRPTLDVELSADFEELTDALREIA